jgi:RimJ/RimL family protein N-acetyltransferase
VKLAKPTLEQCEQVRQWRNAPDVLPMLRTREPLTVEQQAAFYRDVVCNPQSNHRYYALIATQIKLSESLGFQMFFQDEFIGLGGLTYLDRAQVEGEISLILGPEFRRSGLGTHAVQALRAEGAQLGLRWIIGEVYDANPAREFWVKMVARCDGLIRYEVDRMRFRMRTVTT